MVTTYSSGTVNADIYKLDDSLIDSDPEDFIFFSTTTNKTQFLKLTSANSNYVMLLGLVDYATGKISFTNIYMFANSPITAVDLPAGDYVWNVFSNNGSVGQSYSLCVNASLGYGARSFVYATDDLQKIYTSSGSSLKRNGGEINLWYQYNYKNDWTVPPNGYGYVDIRSLLENVQVDGLMHSGEIRYTKGLETKTFQNTLTLNVGIGSKYTFYHAQSGPPHMIGDYRDISGRQTPRYFDSNDASTAPHYIVYDFDQDKVIEFYSTLNHEWWDGSKKNMQWIR